MNTYKKGIAPIAFIIVIVAVLIGGGIYFTNVRQGANESGSVLEQTENDSMIKEEGAMMDKKDDATIDASADSMIIKEDSVMMKDEVMTKKGSYEAYSQEKIALASSGDVVLFFRASWCPTCRGLDADIRANMDKIPAGVTILDVNYDTATALKQKYGVTYQHTLVQVNASGDQITKWTSSPTLASLITNIK